MASQMTAADKRRRAEELASELLTEATFGSFDYEDVTQWADKISKLTSELESAAIEPFERGHNRYEYMRILSPRQFHDLWFKCASAEGRFDDLVDDAIAKLREGK